MMYDNDEEVELIDITEYMDQDSTDDSYNQEIGRASCRERV